MVELWVDNVVFENRFIKFSDGTKEYRIRNCAPGGLRILRGSYLRLPDACLKALSRGGGVEEAFEEGDYEALLEKLGNSKADVILKFRCLFQLRRFKEAQKLLTLLEGRVPPRFLRNRNAECELAMSFPALRDLRRDALFDDYVDPSIVVAKVPGKGNGIVALKGIPAHTTIMIAKALVVSRPDELSLPEALIIRILQCPEAVGTRVAALCGADKSIAQRGDLNSVSAEAAQAVCAVNQFILEDVESDIDFILGRSKPKRPAKLALFHLPSYFNHACLPTCIRLFVEEYVVIKTVRDIEQGEELTLAYVSWDGSYSQRQDALLQWGFHCECDLCVAQKQAKQKGGASRVLELATASTLMEEAMQAEASNNLQNALEAWSQLSDLLRLDKLQNPLTTDNFQDPVYIVDALTALALRRIWFLSEKLGKDAEEAKTAFLSCFMVLGGEEGDVEAAKIQVAES